MPYDIIGDIHGQASRLEALLHALGYRPGRLAWRHPDVRRKAIFVGDFIDRGPEQLRTVGLVRAMVEEGHALACMGNHELNAIAWATPDARVPGEYLRCRSTPAHKGARNRHQHARFLEEVSEDSTQHAQVIAWFKRLPLWLDLPGQIRVVHACWHPQHLQLLGQRLGEGALLRDDLLQEALHEAEGDEVDAPLFTAVEAVLKGIECELPQGICYADPDGQVRHRMRVKWWAQGPRSTLRDVALLPPQAAGQLPDLPAPAQAAVAWRSTDTRPIFFGHYWMSPRQAPEPLAAGLACVDYSAAHAHGKLVAYRWDGETTLRREHFLAV